MIKTNTTISTNEIRERNHPALIFLFVMWVLAIAMLTLPISDTFSTLQKILIILTPIVATVFLVLINPIKGFSIWTVVLSVLVTQTGFQADIGSVRVSALEASLVFLILFYIWYRRKEFSPILSGTVPGEKFLLAFIAISLLLFIVGMLRRDSFTQSIIEFKGFVLYPLTAFIFLIGVKDKKWLQISALTLASWYTWVAVYGIGQFIQGEGVSLAGEVVRVSGDYAPINLYGITLISVALFVLGITVETEDKRIGRAGFILTGLLVLGAITSVARTVMVALAAGILFLLSSSRKSRLYIIGTVIIVSLILVFGPAGLGARIFQLSDSSTSSRIDFLLSGFTSLRENWLVGTGWGNGMIYIPEVGLVASGSIPWYHNDYLNLAVQIGLIGLIPYLLFWFLVLKEGTLAFKAHTSYSPYILGSLAGLVGLLVSALFDHTLWRADIAGLLGWMFGMLTASINLSRQEKN